MRALDRAAAAPFPHALSLMAEIRRSSRSSALRAERDQSARMHRLIAGGNSRNGRLTFPERNTGASCELPIRCKRARGYIRRIARVLAPRGCAARDIPIPTHIRASGLVLPRGKKRESNHIAPSRSSTRGGQSFLEERDGPNGERRESTYLQKATAKSARRALLRWELRRPPYGYAGYLANPSGK